MTYTRAVPPAAEKRRELCELCGRRGDCRAKRSREDMVDRWPATTSRTERERLRV